eukprot:gene22837-25866_t
MSDGSDTITFFQFPSVDTYHVRDELVKVRSLRVFHPDKRIVVVRINELEYVDGFIYANMWRSDTMLKFRADTGEVTQTFNLSAFYNEADNTFVLAGKLWPHCYVTHLQQPSTEETQRRDAAPSHKMFGLLVLVCLFLLWLLAMFHGLCHNCFFAGTSYADRDFPYEPVQP